MGEGWEKINSALKLFVFIIPIRFLNKYFDIVFRSVGLVGERAKIQFRQMFVLFPMLFVSFYLENLVLLAGSIMVVQTFVLCQNLVLYTSELSSIRFSKSNSLRISIYLISQIVLVMITGRFISSPVSKCLSVLFLALYLWPLLPKLRDVY